MIDSSIRTQAGQQYRVLDELPRNTTISYKGTVKGENQSFKVEYKGEIGYVSVAT